MRIKRKSNWYIYLAAFGITIAIALVAIISFRWYLFPDRTESTGLDEKGEVAEDFQPTAEYNFNMLTMLSDEAQDDPELFVILSYNAVDNLFTFIPVPNGISVASAGRTLPNVYTAQGGQKVISQISSITGVQCDCYIKMNREAFVNFVSSYGNVEYDVAKTVIIKDGHEAETINAGENFFTGDMIFNYIMKSDFGEGESYRFNCVGGILSELINQNFRNVDESLLDAYYSLIKEYAETNITEEWFSKRKAALLNTTEYGNSPAEYYVPYGEYADDGSFTIAENSITTIKQKTGLM